MKGLWQAGKGDDVLKHDLGALKVSLRGKPSIDVRWAIW